MSRHVVIVMKVSPQLICEGLPAEFEAQLSGALSLEETLEAPNSWQQIPPSCGEDESS